MKDSGTAAAASAVEFHSKGPSPEPTIHPFTPCLWNASKEQTSQRSGFVLILTEEGRVQLTCGPDAKAGQARPSGSDRPHRSTRTRTKGCWRWESKDRRGRGFREFSRVVGS